MELMDRMIDNLLLSANWETVAKHSYKDMHVRGLTYINLLRNERLTVKLYLFDDYELNNQSHLVYPHNHAYSFYQRTLIGTIDNIRFKPTGVKAGGTPWQVWEYQSSLGTGLGAPRLKKVDLRVGLQQVKERMVEGDGYYLDQEEIHTLRPISEYAASASVQFHDIHKRDVDGTTMFTPEHEQPNCGGHLYSKMTPEECEDRVQEFLSLWRRG